MNYINPQDKLLWHLDTLLELKNSYKTRSPINVEIDLSNRCSHGCEWCHFAYTHTKGPLANSKKPDGYINTGDLFDFELLKNVLRQLSVIGVKSITWTGGGEPTLHPNFKDIIKHTYDLGLDQGIYTHGSHLNLETAEIIKKYCTFAYISLDEVTADDFKSSKGVNRFRYVIEGIQNLVKSDGVCTVGIGFLLHENNYKKYPQMIELASVLQVDYCQFRPIIHYSQEEPSVLIENPSWITELPIINLPNVIFNKDRFEQYRKWSGHGYDTCNWTALQTVITPNGKVWRCVNKRGFEDALLGDLNTESFYEIWSRYGHSCKVNSNCRVMCRGHLANQTLDQVFHEPKHSNFV